MSWHQLRHWLIKLWIVGVPVSIAAQSPVITNVVPAQNASGVAVGSSISVTFDRAMNTSTFNHGTVRVGSAFSGKLGGGFSSQGNTLEFSPSLPLIYGDRITVVLTTGIESQQGDPLARSFVWSFVAGEGATGDRLLLDSSYSTYGTPYSIAAADIDLDSDVDLSFVDNSADSLHVLLNNGAGVFAAGVEMNVGSQPSSLCTGDIDNYYGLDLVIGLSGADSLTILYADGSGAFDPPVSYYVGGSVKGCSVVDVNGDAWPDVITIHNSPDLVRVCRNQADRTFGAPASYPLVGPPEALVTADIDRDGSMDIVLVSYWLNQLWVLLNDGTGNFASGATHAVSSRPTAVVATDLDQDQWIDFAVSNSADNRVGVLRNDGTGNLESAVYAPLVGSPHAILAGDINGDVSPEIAAAVTSSDLLTVMNVSEDLSFTPRWDCRTGTGPRSLAGADFDGDGRLDVASCDADGGVVSVLLNRTFPRIASVNPEGHATGVATGGAMSVVFSTDMDEASATEAGASLLATGSISGPIQGVLQYIESERILTLTPDDPFSPGEIVTATVLAGVLSTDTVALDSSITWSFVVGADRADTLADSLYYLVGPQPWAIISADLNRDGHADLAAASRYSNSVSVHLNLGTGLFDAPTVWGVGGYPYSLATSDIDGDGSLDLITANENSDSVTIRLNGGDGTFAERMDLPLGWGASPVSVSPADFDGDGLTDLAIALRDVDQVSLFANNGDSSFSGPQTCDVANRPECVITTDIDNDGDVDIATANAAAGCISVLTNDGGGAFGASVDYDVAGQWPVRLAAADLNSDGWVDLVSSDSGSNSLTVLHNTGGAFVTAAALEAGTSPAGLSITDVNGDGMPDIAVACQFSHDISVFLNAGEGIVFSQQTYASRPRPYSLAAADFDGDGDVDLAASSFANNAAEEPDSLCIYNSRRITRVIATEPAANDIHASNSAGVTLFFNDAMDVASLPDSGVTISGDISGNMTYSITAHRLDSLSLVPDRLLLPGEQVSVSITSRLFSMEGFRLDYPVVRSFTAAVGDSGGTFRVRRDFATGQKPSAVAPADFDLDGGIDLCVLNERDNSMTVLHNGRDSSLTAIGSCAAGRKPRAVVATDLNNDTYPDLAVAEYGAEPDDGNADSLFVFINDGTGSFGAVAGAAYLAGNGPRAVLAADFDCDGDMDLAVSNEKSNSVVFMENSGNGVLAVVGTVGVDSSPFGMAAADFDDDGDVDLALATDPSARVRVLCNSGTWDFTTRTYYVPAGRTIRSIATGDLNADGRVDLVATSMDSDTAIVFRNTGDSLVFHTAVAVGDGPICGRLGDIDGDGDLDLVAANYGRHTVSLCGNTGAGLFAPKGELTVGANPSAVALVDCNQDYMLDLVALSSESDILSVIFNTTMCCEGRVGDANGTGGEEPTIGDISVMIDALFISGSCDGAIECLAEADVNRSGGPAPICDDLTIGDISILIDYLFIHGAYDPVSNPSGVQLPECL